jgi:hypothetical protein
MEHKLTVGEKALLSPIFGFMIPYNKIVCKVNSANVGGRANSITPSGTPYFSSNCYCNDFYYTNIENKWIFFHEMTHVWQYYHKQNVIISAIEIFVKGHYRDSYKYTLSSEKRFRDFNIEQQAAIVADYWIITQGWKPLCNNDPMTSLLDYSNVIQEFKMAGPPAVPTFEVYPW